MDEYSAAISKFYEVYEPLRKKYQLRSHMRFKLHSDGLIEIWEYEGETRKKLVCRASEESDIECYKRAMEGLIDYGRGKKEREHRRKTTIAG